MMEDDGAIELTVELGYSDDPPGSTLSKLRAWLDSSGRDPREAAMKAKLK
jgi:predicted nucleotidyltransferase